MQQVIFVHTQSEQSLTDLLMGRVGESAFSQPELDQPVSSEVKVAQLCPTLCNPMDYTAHGTLQARILEWVAFLFSRGSSQTRDQAQVSYIAGRFFTS